MARRGIRLNIIEDLLYVYYKMVQPWKRFCLPVAGKVTAGKEKQNPIIPLLTRKP